ncbi:hypothetical protein BB559_007366 [Furculomyces boomerangus]|uniref:Uncharacterized protein n=2 Tax=Harpellales TaxID=61421 RepID=A0A2T9XXM3_9FUNG|nr:hypothetical protein BB559_007366 [Furculomyces boomerangus]PVZ96542.1 hypothetical protein BB558_007549 [Smittium angustum]
MVPWNFVNEYNEIEEDIKEKWSILRTSELLNYKSTQYYCKNKDKYECPAIRKIKQYRINNRFMCCSAFKHSINCVKHGFPININKIILNIYNDNTKKPWEIKKKLSELGLDVSDKQIYKQISYQKKKVKKENNITQSGLIEHCSKHLESSNYSDSHIIES